MPSPPEPMTSMPVRRRWGTVLLWTSPVFLVLGVVFYGLLTFPALLDPISRIERLYRIGGVPESFIVG